MSVTPLNAAQAKMHLRKAVRALTFSHSRAPGGTTADGYASAIRDDGSEIVVEIVSPASTGLSAKELVELFNKDQTRRTQDFSHPRIESEEEALFDVLGEVPCYANNLRFKPELFIASGVEPEKCEATYCLIARKRGKVVGMVSFSVDLNTSENTDYISTDIKSILSIHFNIRLEMVYVCSRYRNKGYGKALMAAVADVFRDEMLHICQQLAPVYALVSRPFKVQPYILSEWVSRSGKLAHLALSDELDLAVDEHNGMYAEAQPERLAVELSYAEDDAGY